MFESAHSIKTFIGAKNFDQSRAFYNDIGFEEITLGNMSYFKINETLGFYLQDFYVKEWVDNSMIFLEVEQLEDTLDAIKKLNLIDKYPTARISDIQNQDWGDVFFVHDPEGVLWQIGSFKK